MIKKGCPHCDVDSFALKYPLSETDNFRIVCDVHPLIEGHILIIPKNHLSCVGEFSLESFEEFARLYEDFKSFLRQTYGKFSAFEHGRTGQTVFHSHIHLLPAELSAKDIVPEKGMLKNLSSLESLREMFATEGNYLFFETKNNLWLADTKISTPGFFRIRFADAVGKPDRGDWKKARVNTKIMKAFEVDIKNLQGKWRSYKSNR